MATTDRIEVFSMDFGDHKVAVHRASDDEGHLPNTALLGYVRDCKDAKEVTFPLSWDDFHDPDLEIIILGAEEFILWWRIMSAGRVLH